MSAPSSWASDRPLTPRTNRLSVILPIRNQRTWAEKAVEAILSQVDPIGSELVVVDDASRDGSTHHLASVFGEVLARKRLSIIRRDRPCGDLGKLWNQGAQASSGAYLSFARPMQVWGPLRLTRLSPWVSSHDLLATRRVPREFEPKSISPLSTPNTFGNEWGESVDWVRVFLQENVAAPGSIVMKRTLFEECKGFTEGYGGLLFPKRPPGSEEYELLLKGLLQLQKCGQESRFTLLRSNRDELIETAEIPELPIPGAQEILRGAEEIKERISLVTLTPRFPRKYWKALALRVKDKL